MCLYGLRCYLVKNRTHTRARARAIPQSPPCSASLPALPWPGVLGEQLKQKELQKLLEQDGVPLRPDVKQVGGGWRGSVWWVCGGGSVWWW